MAALGPALLRVAGELADGTLTWMAAPQVIGERIAPSITAAAEAAGRPRPRVGVGLPVAVTNDVDAALERAAASYAIYGTLPSYRRLLDEAGIEGPAGVVIAGDEDEVAGRIRALADVGATEFLASPIGSRAVREETLRVLGRSPGRRPSADGDGHLHPGGVVAELVAADEERLPGFERVGQRADVRRVDGDAMSVAAWPSLPSEPASCISFSCSAWAASSPMKASWRIWPSLRKTNLTVSPALTSTVEGSKAMSRIVTSTIRAAAAEWAPSPPPPQPPTSTTAATRPRTLRC